ncbi:PREDICTED: gamma-tubulin complex component 6-like [Condylura cristata]|uniref:gamma-tubulin complex component 6-like n=1 Tax=Condylura cristata TaxID=143302 RepID=UPI00064376AA|nr:PREDICTED: gamma-tubulin complex component 6-like [Condylura cristata]
MIQVNHEYLGFRDKSYWTRGYVLLAEAVADGVPAFLRHVAQDAYTCGKTINLLRLCCPRHYLCWSDVPAPPISVTFSLEGLRKVQQECAVYVGRVRRAARDSRGGGKLQAAGPLVSRVTRACVLMRISTSRPDTLWPAPPRSRPARPAALVSRAAGSVQFRQLQLFKHEMQHFVKVVQGYIANQILHVSWCEFRARLARAGDLEELQRAHAEYLHRAVFRGLLTEKAAPVMNIIHSVFSLVLKFRSQLISQPWGPAHGPRGAEHPNFALMQQSYSTFKYYSHFLFKGEGRGGGAGGGGPPRLLGP